MKYLIFSVLLATVVYADHDHWQIQTAENLQSYREVCVTEHGITPEQIAKYKSWNFPDDEKTHVYINCIFNKMGLFDDKTGFNIDHLVLQLGQNQNKDEVKAKIEKCADKNENKDSAAVWAFRGMKCFIAENLPLVQTSLKKPA
uniref:Odorant-binding protein 14 n=1 Tax=Bradysia odoriphaga TaxID=1564500 RepID=A0A2S0X9H2_9DIPT|nr:odorant-binding protein 14 [Bradysia odoriphaga]